MIAPRIALIHATPLAMDPVANAFELLWPEAKRMNLLDDSLSADLALAGSLNQAMVARMVCLAQYVKTCGADAILFTCSAFGPAIDEVKRTISLPTLKPNEAMFSDALDICEQLGGQRHLDVVFELVGAAPGLGRRARRIDGGQLQFGDVVQQAAIHKHSGGGGGGWANAPAQRRLRR